MINGPAAVVGLGAAGKTVRSPTGSGEGPGDAATRTRAVGIGVCSPRREASGPVPCELEASWSADWGLLGTLDCSSASAAEDVVGSGTTATVRGFVACSSPAIAFWISGMTAENGLAPVNVREAVVGRPSSSQVATTNDMLR